MDSSSDLSDPPSSPPSSPLSDLSRSTPSLSPAPMRYPSPPSTAPSGSASPMKVGDSCAADSICVNPDGAPPRKRRRVEQKPRTTEHLNLEESPIEEVDQLLTALKKKKKIVIIAGAGISVSAGIPDFRSKGGLFTTLRKDHKLKGSGKELFDASVYKHDSSTSTFHDMVREMAQQTMNAQPTPFHHMVASIAEEGRLQRLYTQNVDGIDTSMKPLATNVPLNAKGPWPKTIQLHGGLEKMVCSKCRDVKPFVGELFEGPEPPLCKECEETDNVRTSHAGKRSHGIGRLRPRMVLYNEYNPDEDAIVNVFKADLKARPDAVIVVGTSMKIPGVRSMVKDMCKVVRGRKGGLAAWINLDPEPSGVDLKDCWDLVVQGKSDDVATLVALPHWDQSPAIDDDEVKVDEKKFELVKENIRSTELEVRLPSSSPSSPSSIKGESRDATPIEPKPKSIEKVQGIPTPTTSPQTRTALPSRPVEKSKQTQLVFSGKSTATKSTIATGVKKPAKRGRPRKTEAKLSVTVKSAFRATKPAVAASTKIPAKRAFDSESDAKAARQEFNLRPRQKSEDQKLHQRAVDTQLQQETVLRAAPTTPTQPERPGSAYAQTISPPSKPHGMADMID